VEIHKNHKQEPPIRFTKTSVVTTKSEAKPDADWFEEWKREERERDPAWFALSEKPEAK
jgi:hypothetical protein